MTSRQTLILASSSPYRRAVLKRLGLGFDWRSPDIDESILPGEAPDDLVRRLSEAKAAAVAGKYSEGLVIGSDQMAVLGGRIIGKPADHDDALGQLRAASGAVTVLHCGIAVLNAATGRMQSQVEHVEVECRELADDEIERYLATDAPYDCCGSLKVEGMGISLLRRVRSDDPNAITGLPVIRLFGMLREEGFSLP